MNNCKSQSTLIRGSKTTDTVYHGLPINTNENKGQACLTQVLDKHHAHLEDMTNKHSKVMQVRFDLHYPQDNSVTPNKQHLHDFNYNLQRKLNREQHVGGHKVDSRLITVTEQHNSEHPHIHGVLLVNANVKRKYLPIMEQVERIWKLALGTDAQGLVDHCNRSGKNGIIIDRNKEDFEDKKKQCSHQGSYLAKVRGKENNAKGTWLVGGTRLPKDSVKDRVNSI